MLLVDGKGGVLSGHNGNHAQHGVDSSVTQSDAVKQAAAGGHGFVDVVDSEGTDLAGFAHLTGALG